MSTRKCVFSTPFIKEQVDPRVAKIWLDEFHDKAPYAKLRQMWKTQHCTKVDPYNSGCPYAVSDCALSFLVAVERTAAAHPARPTGYFRAVALSMGLDRADNKPLARDTLARTDVHKEGHPGGPSDSPGERRPASPGGGWGVNPAGPDAKPVLSESADLHRTTSGPQRIGELLGALDLRPHQRPPKDEQEGDK